MRQCRSYGSVRGAVSDDRPYRDLSLPYLCHLWLSLLVDPADPSGLHQHATCCSAMTGPSYFRPIVVARPKPARLALLMTIEASTDERSAATTTE